jgi:hypothetical protein
MWVGMAKLSGDPFAAWSERPGRAVSRGDVDVAVVSNVVHGSAQRVSALPHVVPPVVLRG